MEQNLTNPDTPAKQDTDKQEVPLAPQEPAIEQTEFDIARAACADENAHPEDIAMYLDDLPLEEQISIFTSLDTELAGEVLAELDEYVRIELLENIDNATTTKIISDMSPDDAADMLDDLEVEHRNELLDSLDLNDANELRLLMAFDPDTAGGLMNTELVILNKNLTADQAIQQIRDEIEEKENPYYGYVVDDHDKLMGVLSLRDLLLCKPRVRLEDEIQGQNLVTLEFSRSKEDVVQVFGHYSFMALPVVDYSGHLLGVITHDDIIDIMHENASEDMLGMVGAGQDESADTPWFESVKMRLPWLMVNMVNSAASASVVSLFEASIQQMTVLAALMPIVANQAGNTGQQALAVMIRQLAIDKFDKRKTMTAVTREARIGLANGLVVGIIVLLLIGLWTSNWTLATIMSSALLLNMLLGATAGASIPLILRALKRDPAQASSIFLTTLTDGGGFFIFLGLATLFLL